jgi:hypothetical protein
LKSIGHARLARYKARPGHGTIALRSTLSVQRTVTGKCHAIRKACRRGGSNLDACHADRSCAIGASRGPAIGFTAGSKRVLPRCREDDAPVTGDNRKPQLERAAF